MEHVTSKDGTMIAVEKTGDGPAVVLVDGAFTYRAIDQFPASLAELLAPRFTVAHYERRGRGESGDTLPYAVEREIEDLAAVIDAVGGSASVLGMSSASVLALQASVSGVAVERLAMWEPPFVVDDSRPPLPADYVARLDELIAAGRRGDAMEYALTTAVGLPVDDVRAMRAEPFFALMEAVAHTAAYDGRIMGDLMSGRPLPFERWAGLAIPTLVLVGEKSDEFWQTGTRAFAAGLPTVRHRGIDTQAEEAHAVSPAALAPVVEEFFAT